METSDSPKLVTFLGKHVVSIGGLHYEGTKDKPGKEHCFFTSGIIMTFKNARVCLYATAGHVLEQLEKQMENRRFGSFSIIDYMGVTPASRRPIPIDYESAQKFYIHEANGVDFGAVLLSPLYTEAMRFNAIEFYDEDQWRKQPDWSAFDRYFVLGIPAALVNNDDPEHAKFKLVMIPINRLREIPSDFMSDLQDAGTPEDIATADAMFYGKIDDSVDLPSDEEGLDSIVGMSGGPIVAFDHSKNEYWIVALQSSWFRSTRHIRATPLPLVGEALERAIDKTIKGIIDGLP